MDVSIKVSLQGGHSWEFVCDEDDPMVFGLVSALPGASLDSALPPDGLIQIEARSGERMFLTRSSLVAVTISRLASAARAGVPADTASPFTLLPEFLDGQSVAALLALSAGEKHTVAMADLVQAIELDALPDIVSARLVEVIAQLPAAMAVSGETHLDICLRLLRGSAVSTPSEPDDRDVLGFLLYLDGAKDPPSPGTVHLPSGHGAVVESDVSDALPLASNCALLFPPGAEPRLRVHHSQVLVMSGSLRTGAADGPS